MYPNSFKSIVLLYEKGKETSHVAEMFNCSKSSIYAWKKDQSIQRMQRKKNIILNVEGRLLDRFPNTEKKSELKITTEGTYSLSGWKDANLTSKLIKKYMKTANLTITDGTANVGGNVISFANVFTKVNAVEINKTNFKVLQHNIKNVYGLDNVRLHHDDYTKIFQKLQQDVVFLDAPWGGVDYKKHESLDLTLSGMKISHWCGLLNKYCKLIVLKVPINFNKSEIKYKKEYKLKKYNLLFV